VLSRKPGLKDSAPEFQRRSKPSRNRRGLDPPRRTPLREAARAVLVRFQGPFGEIARLGVGQELLAEVLQRECPAGQGSTDGSDHAVLLSLGRTAADL
jgi:hypothetical protein